MGIYIKGMKMPDHCMECEIAIEDNDYDKHCPFTKVECSNIARQVNCPLTEVPEPHEINMLKEQLESAVPWSVADKIGEDRERLEERVSELEERLEWIPCSERLPDTDVPVLVSDGVYVWEDELQEDYEDGKTMYWWDSQCSFDFNDTAWMPLPKPYREDGE